MKRGDAKGADSKKPHHKRMTEKQRLCIECKKCCTKVGVYTDPSIYELPEKDIIHFYEARGAEVNRSGSELFILFDVPCPHLTTQGCDIYERRPKICRIYSGLDEFGDECLWSDLCKKDRSAK
ncbi:MAG TPA: YkgJ family cysteine cluster protein [Dissulfurispiraceae bacterium]|nr:YkgJ family cysteine cluster protein [Dissulfurispiraceae bacterium]